MRGRRGGQGPDRVEGLVELRDLADGVLRVLVEGDEEGGGAVVGDGEKLEEQVGVLVEVVGVGEAGALEDVDAGGAEAAGTVVPGGVAAGEDGVDGGAGAADDVGLAAALDGGAELGADVGFVGEEGAGDDPALGAEVGEDLADDVGEAEGIERGGGGLEEAVAFGVEDEDGDGLLVLEDVAAPAAEGVEAVLDEEGLAVGEEGARLGVEAEHDLDGALHDLAAALGDVEDLGERVERIALVADVHGGAPLSRYVSLRYVITYEM